MRKFLAASIAALTLSAAGVTAHAQGYPAPVMPPELKGEKIVGVVPNPGVEGGWEWIVEGVADGHHFYFMGHKGSDGWIHWTTIGEYREGDKQHSSLPGRRAETVAKRPSNEATVATSAAAASFSSSSHH